MMRIHIKRESRKPVYQQIADHIRQGILSGRLAQESSLPATRKLADALQINRLTVEKAYHVLELEGLVYAHMGSGTFVSSWQRTELMPREKTPDTVHWQRDIPLVTERLAPYDITLPSNDSSLISFASGSGDQSFYPLEEFRKTFQRMMRNDGFAAMDYGDRRGFFPLRETISQILASQGISIEPDEILVTGGSQQAIALTCHYLLQPGDEIIVENPTYAGALQLFRGQKLNITGIDVDEKGMRTDQLEEYLKQVRPQLIYTIPNFHNPTGTSLSIQRRHHLVELAAQYNVPILEDDYVGDLRYEGRALPTLKSLDQYQNVLYTSTFSKMLMPGLRVGFLAAEGPVLDQISTYKWAMDLSTSNLIQHGLHAFMTVGRYRKHLDRSIRIYKRRRDLMVDTLKKHMPKNCTWFYPAGGFFIWLKLPEKIADSTLKEKTSSHRVAVSAGSQFFINEPEHSCLRLNFAASSEEDIITGIKRLAKICQH